MKAVAIDKRDGGNPVSGLYGANLELSNLPDVAAARENLGVGLTDSPTFAGVVVNDVGGLVLNDAGGVDTILKATIGGGSVDFSTGGSNRTVGLGGSIALGGDVTTADAFTTSGLFPVTLTVTASTNVALPTTGTLATLAGTETLDNKTLSTLTVTGATVLGDATGDTITLNADAITQPTAVTHTRTAEASTAEVLETWKVSDDGASSFVVSNAVSTDGQFAPQFVGTQGSTLVALAFKGVIPTDTGTAPAIVLIAQVSGSVDVATRPLLQVRNRATNVITVAANGNTGFGTATPNAAALIDLTSTTKGFLPPRMTTTQRDAISSPPSGLLVYNTTTGKLNVRGAAAWEVVTSL